MENKGNLDGLWHKEYLSFIKNEAAIHCLERQIFGDICMNKDPDESSICHHKLVADRQGYQMKRADCKEEEKEEEEV